MQKLQYLRLYPYPTGTKLIKCNFCWLVLTGNAFADLLADNEIVLARRLLWQKQFDGTELYQRSSSNLFLHRLDDLK